MTCLSGNYPPFHVVGTELSLNCLPDDAVHVSGFGTKDTDFLQLDMTSQIDALPHHG
jgi:hypothetical protein